MKSTTARIPLRSATRIMLFYTVLSLIWFFFSNHILPIALTKDESLLGSLGFWVTLTTFITGMTASSYFLYFCRQKYRQHQQEIKLKVAERDRFLNRFFDLPLLGMAITANKNGDWIRFNDHLCTLFNLTREELYRFNLMALTHPDDRARDDIEWEKMKQGESEGYRREKRFVLRDGSVLYAIVDSRCIRDTHGGLECIINVIEDITARKNSEFYLIRQNNLYNMLSQTNQVIVRCQNKKQLLENICRIAVQHGGFAFAWIRLDPLHQASCCYHPIKYGQDAGFLTAIEEYQHQYYKPGLQEPENLLPSDRVMKTGQHLIINDFQEDRTEAPLRISAEASGFRSAGYLVLREQGTIIGTLNLYSDEPGVFTPEVLYTLNDMIMDVTFALDTINQAEERAIALTALQNASEVIDASPTVLFRWQPNSSWKLEYVSSNVQRWGYKANDFISGELTMSDLLHPDDLQRVWAEVIHHIERRHREYSLECRIKTAEGHYLWVENHVTTAFDRRGRPTSLTGVMTDISQQKADEFQLRQAAIVFESTREGIIITDAEHKIIKVNRAFLDLFGYEEQELLHQHRRILNSGKHNDYFLDTVQKSLDTYGLWRGEVWSQRKDHKILPMMTSINPVRDDTGKLLYYISIYTDISQLKDSEARLEHMALHDPLTGLPNRAMLTKQLGLALHEAEQSQRRIALLMLDLDHFKNVNDSFGHHYGDELLHQVSDRLKHQLRSTDIVCRLGGDEFTVLMKNNPNLDDVSILANKIIDTLHQPFTLSNERSVLIGTSIGISLYPEHGQTADVLMQQADTAMYQAKQEGRDDYRYFSEALFQKAKARLELEQRLHRAITGQEFQLFFQPQIELKTNQVIGAEVLLRWNDPEYGVIPPSEFITVAEETGLIQNIGEWVLFEACRQGALWLEAGLPSIHLAVNLSPLQLHHGAVEDMIKLILKNTGFPAANLELELTESALMEQPDEAAHILQGLRQHGIRIAIDDFGTGYSSLAYLKQFPLDVLKIDKRFVDDIPHEQDDMEIAASIVAMGHSLRLTVLAEGVENQEQLDFLKQQGCDYYQGYFGSEPLSATAFEDYLKAQTLITQDTSITCTL